MFADPFLATSDLEGSDLALEVAQLFVQCQLTLAIAESCTGGWLGARLTAVPGSSAFFIGGVIAYADSVKTGVLGVPQEVLEVHGAVSAETALYMARGVRKVVGTEIGLSITGIAGPAGGTAEKPVGTTFIGLVAPAVETVDRILWTGDRNWVRAQSVEAALMRLFDLGQENVRSKAGRRGASR